MQHWKLLTNGTVGVEDLRILALCALTIDDKSGISNLSNAKFWEEIATGRYHTKCKLVGTLKATGSTDIRKYNTLHN